MPYYEEDSEAFSYQAHTVEEKLVSEYTGLSFKEVDDVNIIEFLTYLRDGYIYQLNQTQEGRDYLKKCHRLSQTEPETDKLRAKYGAKRSS